MTLSDTINIAIVLLLQASLCSVSGQDQASVCSNGDLQLKSVDNDTTIDCTTEHPTEVHVCADGQWYSVCAENWRGRLSQKTCKDLGYTTGYQLPVPVVVGTDNKEEISEGVLFNCTGEEDEVSECTFTNSSCSHQIIIHLNCITDDDLNSTKLSCTVAGDLRLAGGEVEHEGDLQVCMFGVWGSVCDNTWTREDSTVACRQLGFTTGTVTENNASMSVIDQCTSPIHLYNVTCGGEEETLVSCSRYNIISRTSSYFNDNACGVFLSCLGTRLTCREGEVKLLPFHPDYPGAGWLLVCLNNEWGTVCDRNWDILDSTVACKQLGYIGGFHVELPFSNTQRDNYAIHASNMMCTGNENRVVDCQYSTEHNNCFHIRDTFLQCREVGDGCGNGDLRLVDGPTVKSGRLEVCWNNIWGTVCHIGWIRLNTIVACRQMGWLMGYEERTEILPDDDIPTILEETNCLGSEKRLIDCDFIFNRAFSCFLHENDAFLTCLDRDDLDNCEDGDLRLVGGRNEEEGLLKICHEKVWGTICNLNWDSDIDATVACRQLGFRQAVPQVHSVGNGRGPIHFTDFLCNGTEQSLVNCSYEPLEIYSNDLCDHTRDVYLACQDPIHPVDTSDSNVIYALVPLVLLITGFFTTICVIVSFLTCRKKDHHTQPSQDSSISSGQVTTRTEGHFYRNATFVDVTSSPQNLMPISAQDHYMMSPSVMDHTYETIDDDDLILRAQYKGEYHQYAQLEEEGDSRLNSLSNSPSTYDKLNAKSEGPCTGTLNPCTGMEQSKQVDHRRYSMLELQSNVKEKAYNKLQRKRRDAVQIPVLDKEDYEQIDLPDSQVLEDEKTVDYQKFRN